MGNDKDDIMSASIGEVDDEFAGLQSQFDTNFAPRETAVQELPENRPQEPVESSKPEEGVPVAQPTPEPSTEPSGAVSKPSKTRKAAKKAKSEPKPPKEEESVDFKCQRAIRTMLRRAGKSELPEIAKVLKNKTGELVAISDIALFTGEPDDEILAELATECPKRNRVNLSAEVQKARVLQVGAQIIEAGRMYLPIQIVRIEEDGELECTSGRHRLAFLALAYGCDTKIPVNIEVMTLAEARDAVVVANDARPTKALERAEHAVLRAVGGNVDAEQDELYLRTATSKISIRKYCIFSVLERNHPSKLAFKVSQTSSRRDGGLTTITNVENFWNMALDWSRGMERKEFDAALKASVKFLNELTQTMQEQKEFDGSHHLAAMTLSAIGKYYRAYAEITGRNAVEIVGDIAKQIVKMGEVGRQKSEKIYKALTSALSPKK